MKNSFRSTRQAGEYDPEYFKILWENGILKNITNNDGKKSLRCSVS